MGRIQLLSSDLNGTLVSEHTMSHMILLYIGKEQYAKANQVFQKQTQGQATMAEAFSTAAPLTCSLTLRQAIEYTKTHMHYIPGFHDLITFLAQNHIPLIINSTGYSVTIYAIREQIGRDKIHGSIGNRLCFGLDGDVAQTLTEPELEQRVREYFTQDAVAQDPIYDRITATGKIELGITDEAAKASLLLAYVHEHFPHIKPENIAHMGDTIGDLGGIVGIAEQGGTGIAFNYNTPLAAALQQRMRKPLSGKIHLVDPKSEHADLRNILPILK